MRAPYHFAMTLTWDQLAYLQKTVQERIFQIEQTECNNPTVRLELYAEMAALRVALEQLGGAV